MFHICPATQKRWVSFLSYLSHLTFWNYYFYLFSGLFCRAELLSPVLSGKQKEPIEKHGLSGHLSPSQMQKQRKESGPLDFVAILVNHWNRIIQCIPLLRFVISRVL